MNKFDEFYEFYELTGIDYNSLMIALTLNSIKEKREQAEGKPACKARWLSVRKQYRDRRVELTDICPHCCTEFKFNEGLPRTCPVCNGEMDDFVSLVDAFVDAEYPKEGDDEDD